MDNGHAEKEQRFELRGLQPEGAGSYCAPLPCKTALFEEQLVAMGSFSWRDAARHRNGEGVAAFCDATAVDHCKGRVATKWNLSQPVDVEGLRQPVKRSQPWGQTFERLDDP